MADSEAPIAIQFSHANGFPAGTYRKLFAALASDFSVHAIERIGHDGRYPITDGWPHLLDELLAELERAGAARVLVGHSLGGILSLMAAHARPSQVRAVIMLDSPIISPAKAMLLSLGKKTGLDECFSPARLTKNRREVWPSRDDVRGHFASKALFREFDDDVLNDYAMSGTVEQRDPVDDMSGVQLAFEREREYWIYRTIPHHLHRLVRDGIVPPVAFIGGTRSSELRLVGARATQALVGSRFRWFEGGHLFPMERPVETAGVIRELLASMGIAQPSKLSTA